MTELEARVAKLELILGSVLSKLAALTQALEEAGVIELEEEL